MYPMVPNAPSATQKGKLKLDHRALFSSNLGVDNVEIEGSKKSPGVDQSRSPLEGGAQFQTKTKVLRSKKKVRPVVPVDPVELLEPDKYGTEMGKDARVWKIYVKEADKWDEELIDGWNRSLDVILVFAALFSAISAAFIIESSKMLTDDPNTTTLNALLAISHNLATIFNGPSGNTSTIQATTTSLASTSAPPGHAVLINTLWYFSLSLSVATSLLSMLAKDWCHSFGANRTGHSYDQALRRQRKWTMIEQWKMQELITVLPFVIHSSLLLFAIGLCIYIWDINRAVAIPVICVTGVASAFYIWSSVMASLVKLFPYTTILSRIVQSDYMQSKYKATKEYGKACMSSGLDRLFAAASVCLYALCWMITAILYLVQLPMAAVYRIRNKPEDRNHLDSSLENTKKLVSGGIHPKLHKWLISVRRNVSDFSRPWTPHGSDHDHVASLALRWLIQNCENASSVDAALQAIAGASAKIPKEPLESCRAVIHIVRRLAADPDSEEAERSNQLYTRALTILGSKGEKGAKGSQVNLSSAEVTLRNFHPEHERQIDDLITSTDFSPTPDNLEALTLGSNAASLSFRLLKGEDTDATDIFAKLTAFLLDHIGSTVKQLNSATLRSLTNTTVLLTSCSPVPLFSPDDGNRCMRSCFELTSFKKADPMESVLDACTAFLVCLVLHSPSAVEEPDQPPRITIGARIERATSFLTDQHSRTYLAKSAFYHILMTEVLFSWDSEGDKKMSQDIADKKQQLSMNYLRESLGIRQHTSDRRRAADTNQQQLAISEFITAVDQVCQLTAHPEPENYASSNVAILSPPIYCLFVWVACMTRIDKNQEMCDELLSNLAFPTLTAEFATVVDEVLPMLWDTYTGQSPGPEDRSQPWRFSTSRLWQVEGTNSDWLATRPKHFAATQLWILLCLVGDSSSDAQKKLKGALESRTKPDLGDSGIRTFKKELEDCIISDYQKDHSIKVYSARVIGCILEDCEEQHRTAGGQLAAMSELEAASMAHKVTEELQHVPTSLQGLASFTDRPRATQLVHPSSNQTPAKGRLHRWSLLTGLRKRSRFGGIGSHSLPSSEPPQRMRYRSSEAQENAGPLVRTQLMEEPEEMTEVKDRHDGHVSIPILPADPSLGDHHPDDK
ncbi:unnamed protein product [Rhizoctonia solani]|uniref:DUF6535 domain-containing protein n=1 Tax=Rhizoctonia solani TaxID=456999 RepID=A0A8H3HYF4_9AGAM|nr:unnamed protein product [Rhizoctonia solani]